MKNTYTMQIVETEGENSSLVHKIQLNDSDDLSLALKSEMTQLQCTGFGMFPCNLHGMIKHDQSNRILQKLVL